jgi:hypothetical protein
MMVGFVRRVASGAAALALAASLVGSAGADEGGYMPTSHPFLIVGNTLGLSANWTGWASYAGLAGLAQKGSVSYATGDWVVPAVKCDASDDDSSVWVGIDGLYSGFVEQVGTQQSCKGGVASYKAWWEMYPAPKQPINLAVKPGDTVRGEVTYAGNGQFVLAVTNLSTGQSFKTTQSNPNALRQTAEWIVEAPYNNNGVVPLANFGSVTFDNGQATINGKTGPIAKSGLLSLLNTQGATMITLGSLIKATATNPTLTAGGDSFKVTWQHN